MTRSEREEEPEPAVRRLLVPELAKGEHRVAGDAAHHALHVLRLGIGDRVSLFDGAGHEAAAEITAVDRAAAVIRVAAEEPVVQPRPELDLWVGMAVPKGARADWAVEKLTELGVSRIRWLTCERSMGQPRPNRIARWRRLAAAAAQQCGRADLPGVDDPMPMAAVLAEATAPLALIADRDGRPLTVRPELVRGGATGGLLVGPEGGFTRRELEGAEKAGYTRIGLGIWTLRVETAAVAGAAVLLGALSSGARR